ncbi:uncharacterized protein LOC111053922 isoform X2 [Nilaparvata lugens]|uniref:uncharacterized protein LOC111053922 isoform X2 n=1 Tax=Nilaparvata lugens TaxID=108931 RepID=UPI00193DA097|nr:uncharacterized protein LOC111053922 isoform X2 [Nilaparvata lugens]
MKMVSLLRCFLILLLLRHKEADGRSVNYEYEDDDDDWAWTWGRDLETGTNDLDRHGRQLSKRAGGVSERQRRVEEAEDAGWLGLGKRQPRFTPYVSVGAYPCGGRTHTHRNTRASSTPKQHSFTPFHGVGVLSDMQQFFDNLKTNLDALETIPPDDKDSLLLGKQVTVTAPQASAVEKERHFRPSATAAYLHALRNHRPSYKIRNFVESPEPVSLRGTNRYDPSLLWTGLGRRRR